MKTREQLIRESEVLIQWLDKQLDGLEMRSDQRNRLAGACLDTAHEHQKAIVLLVANHLPGSAFTLVRPLYEAYIRGLWFRDCTEKEMSAYQKGSLKKIFGDLVKEVEKQPGHERRVLSSIKNNSWNVMSGFIHTRFEQAVRRLTETTIEPSYPEEEIVGLIEFSNGIGCLAALDIFAAVDRNDLANALLQKMKEIWPESV